MPPHGTEDAGLDEPVLARHVHWERGRKRAADMQGAGRVTERRADLPLAHLLRNDEEEVRKPNKLPLVRPPRRESEVALELPGERAECLGAPVVLQVELARSAGMQVPPEPVGLDLGGPGADPVLRPPGGKAMALVASGGLGERAEERVHPEAVGEQLVRSVAVIGDPWKVRGPDALGLSELGQAELGEEPARRGPPLPTVKDEMNPRSLSSFIRC